MRSGPKKGAKYKRRKKLTGKKCATCGKTYSGLLSRGRYCSNRCRDTAAKRRKRGGNALQARWNEDTRSRATQAYSLALREMSETQVVQENPSLLSCADVSGHREGLARCPLGVYGTRTA